MAIGYRKAVDYIARAYARATDGTDGAAMARAQVRRDACADLVADLSEQPVLTVARHVALRVEAIRKGAQ